MSVITALLQKTLLLFQELDTEKLLQDDDHIICVLDAIFKMNPAEYNFFQNGF